MVTDDLGNMCHTSPFWEKAIPGKELGSLGIRCVNAIDETKRPRFVEVPMSCGWGKLLVVGQIRCDRLC